MNARILCLISTVFTLLGGAAFGGGTWYWAGTTDGRWDNPANWRVDEGGTLVVATDCPGVITDDSGEIANDQPGATAVFGAVAAGAATTIDTTHLKSIYAVKVRGADAPSYQFGTADTQTLYSEAIIDGVRSSFTVEAGVQTKQVVKAIIGPGFKLAAGAANAYDIRNDGAEELQLWKHWGITATGNQQYYVYGSGPISYWASATDWALYIDFLNSGEIRFPSRATAHAKVWSFAASPAGVTKKVVIPANCLGLRVNEGGGGIKQMYKVHCDVLVTGDETGVGNIDLYGSGSDTFQFAVDAGKTLRLEVPVKLTSPAKYTNLFIFGPGRTELAAANANSGPLDLCGKAVVAVEKIGNKGCAVADSNIGTGSVIRYGRMSDSTHPAEGTLEYIGAGESFDRDIELTSSAIGRVRNAGTGTLTMTGTAELAPDSASGALALDAATAPIVFSGALAGTNKKPTLRIEGASTVTLTAMPDETIALAGGNLHFDIEGDALVANSLTAAAGVGTVTVPAGKSLTVNAFTATPGAVVDFQIPAGSSVKLPNASAGRISGVRVNGSYAVVNEDGYLEANKTVWTEAADGTWGTAANWSRGVPQTEDQAEVTAVGAGDYTVDASGLTTWPDTLVVGTGVDATKATVKLDGAPNVGDRAIALVRGGELVAANGFNFTPSKEGAVNLGGAPAALTLEEGSRLVLDGGTAKISQRTGEYLQKGGELLLTNDATVVWGTSAMRMTGEMTLAGRSFVTNAVSAPYTMVPFAPGESLHLTVRDKSYFEVKQTSLMLGENAGDRVTVDVYGLSDSDSVFACCSNKTSTTDARVYFAGVGYKDGTATVNVHSGYVRPGNYGWHLGTTYAITSKVNTDRAYFPTGILNIDGGVVVACGYGHPYSSVPSGLIVGDGLWCKANPESHCTGLVNLSGGTLRTAPGISLIGAGCAEGHVVQTGGQFSHQDVITATDEEKQKKPDGSRVYRLPMVIGFMGGEGTYVLSNGTATCDKKLYVGGCPTNQLEFSVGYPWNKTYTVYGRTGAKGLLDICGGSFKMTSTNEVIVGEEGSGTLAFEPAWRNADNALVKGLFQADTVVLSDQTDSTIRFTLGDEGTAFLNVTNRLVVTGAAKLVIDASGVTGRLSSYTKLASVNAFEGAFDPANIEIAVPAYMEQEGNVAVFERNGEKGIWLRRAPQGMTLILR